MLNNQRAHTNCFFVCPHCGYLSEDRYGFRRLSDQWSGHCIVHARMVHLAQMRLNSAFRATHINGQPVGDARLHQQSGTASQQGDAAIHSSDSYLLQVTGKK